MFCPKCNAPIDDSAKFCTTCGAPIEQPQQPQQPPQPQYSQPQYQQPPQPQYQQPQYQQPPYQQPPYQQPYHQTPYGYAQPGGYKVPIKKRSVGLCILLSIITCGIYGLIWFIGMVDDLNKASQRPGDTNGVTVWLLGIITCGIYAIYWMYKAGEKVDQIRVLNGAPSGNSGIIYLLLTICGFGIIAYCMIQSELNKVAAIA